MRLRLPERCKFCGAAGTVRPETTIRDKTVTVQWCCNHCDRGWPITDTDYQPDRRRDVSERRKQTRTDRRNRRRPE